MLRDLAAAANQQQAAYRAEAQRRGITLSEVLHERDKAAEQKLNAFYAGVREQQAQGKEAA